MTNKEINDFTLEQLSKFLDKVDGRIITIVIADKDDETHTIFGHGITLPDVLKHNKRTFEGLDNALKKLP